MLELIWGSHHLCPKSTGSGSCQMTNLSLMTLYPYIWGLDWTHMICKYPYLWCSSFAYNIINQLWDLWNFYNRYLSLEFLFSFKYILTLSPIGYCELCLSLKLLMFSCLLSRFLPSIVLPEIGLITIFLLDTALLYFVFMCW